MAQPGPDRRIVRFLRAIREIVQRGFSFDDTLAQEMVSIGGPVTYLSHVRYEKGGSTQMVSVEEILQADVEEVREVGIFARDEELSAYDSGADLSMSAAAAPTRPNQASTTQQPSQDITLAQRPHPQPYRQASLFDAPAEPPQLPPGYSYAYQYDYSDNDVASQDGDCLHMAEVRAPCFVSLVIEDDTAARAGPEDEYETQQATQPQPTVVTQEGTQDEDLPFLAIKNIVRERLSQAFTMDDYDNLEETYGPLDRFM